MWLTLNGRIRWVKLNGRIRWVKLNEGRRRWMRKGGKEDMRGKNTWGEGLFGGVSIIFILQDCIGAFFGGRLEDCITGFWLEKLVVGLLQGGTVAGSFGLGGQESLRNLGARELERLCS
jgi:hypothetical protein